MSELSVATVYFDALYYSVTTLTTVGYGDRVPHTDAEKIMSILCELAGSVIFGIIAGSLSAIAMSESMTRREIKNRSAMLDEFMRTKNVPSEVCVRMTLARAPSRHSSLQTARQLRIFPSPVADC